MGRDNPLAGKAKSRENSVSVLEKNGLNYSILFFFHSCCIAAVVAIIGNNADFNLEQRTKPTTYTTGNAEPL